MHAFARCTRTGVRGGGGPRRHNQNRAVLEGFLRSQRCRTGRLADNAHWYVQCCPPPSSQSLIVLIQVSPPPTPETTATPESAQQYRPRTLPARRGCLLRGGRSGTVSNSVARQPQTTDCCQLIINSAVLRPPSAALYLCPPSPTGACARQISTTTSRPEKKPSSG